MSVSKSLIFLSVLVLLAVSMLLSPVVADPGDHHAYDLRVTACIAFAFFMLAYVLFWNTAATSNNFSMRRLGRWWKRLHTFGMHYIWLIFAQSRVGGAFDDPGYGLFVMVSFGGLGLRILAWFKHRAMTVPAGV